MANRHADKQTERERETKQVKNVLEEREREKKNKSYTFNLTTKETDRNAETNIQTDYKGERDSTCQEYTRRGRKRGKEK